jgi:hypothetical protein
MPEGRRMCRIVQLAEPIEGGEIRLDTIEVLAELKRFCRNWKKARKVIRNFVRESFPWLWRTEGLFSLTPALRGERVVGFWLNSQELIEELHPGETAAYLYANAAGVDAAILDLLKDIEAAAKRRKQAKAPVPEPLVSADELARRLELAKADGHAILTVGASVDGPDLALAVIKGEKMDVFFAHGEKEDEGFAHIELPAFPPELVASIIAELNGERRWPRAVK